MTQRSASSPPIKLAPVQILRKSVVAAAVAILCICVIFIGSKWEDGHALHEGIEIVGVLLIATCIVGRTWTSLYIGGKKDVALVTAGPYSVCRNPLYFFSVIGAIGVGAQVGSVVFALILGVSTWVLFSLVAQREERALEAAYGADYRDYCARVHRFFPRFSLWRGDSVINVHVANVTRTFIDACAFLLAIPIAETIEYLQGAGVIRVLLHVP